MDISRLIAEHDGDHVQLVALLQDVQDQEGYLPREALEQISKRLEVPLTQLYGLATFYRAFYLKPRGRHTVTCCMGTACHVRGAPRVVDALERELRVGVGETTEDLMVNLETVNCVGACALGPLLLVDGKYHGHITPTKAQRLVKRLRKGADGDVADDS